MKSFVLLVLLFFGMMTACIRPAEKADQIFVNGVILTMDSVGSQAEALAIKDGKILSIGKKEEIMKYRGDSTKITDLAGKTLTPGFVDPHSHFLAAVISVISANISSPPIDSVRCINDITDKLTALKKKLQSKPGDILIGMGLDPDQLKEKRYPTIKDLDPLFPDNPVVLVHASGHIGVYNSAALKLAGISSATKDPAGGIIGRFPGTQSPNGVVYENAWFGTSASVGAPTAERLAKHIMLEKASGKAQGKIPATLPPDVQEAFTRLINAGQLQYAREGYTTAQEGSSSMATIKMLKLAASQKILYLDLVSLIAAELTDTLVGNPEFHFGEYNNHLTFRGVKFICDGSPQGKTAYLSQPMLPGSGCTHDCSGKPNISASALDAGILKCYRNKVPVFFHANGDAAIQMIIDGHEKAIKTLNLPDTNRGTVVIHSQFITPQQLSKYKQHHIFPSFFTNHCYYWGDVHMVNLGKERAFFLSPLKAALDSGIVFSNHTDYNVTPLNAIFTIWTAVNRVSRTGVVIGPDQRISPYEALKAITINSALEIGEEKIKGSLKPGKLADLVILSDNPLTVDPMKIREIKVVETIKEGKSVYNQQNSEMQ